MGLISPIDLPGSILGHPAVTGTLRRRGVSRYRIAAHVSIGRAAVAIEPLLLFGRLLQLHLAIGFELAECLRYRLYVTFWPFAHYVRDEHAMLGHRVIGVKADDDRRLLVAVAVVVHVDVGQTLRGEAGGLAVGVVLDLHAENERCHAPTLASPFPIGLKHQAFEQALVSTGESLKRSDLRGEFLGGLVPRCALGAMLGGTFEEGFLLGRGGDGVVAASALAGDGFVFA